MCIRNNVSFPCISVRTHVFGQLLVPIKQQLWIPPSDQWYVLPTTAISATIVSGSIGTTTSTSPPPPYEYSSPFPSGSGSLASSSLSCACSRLPAQDKSPVRSSRDFGGRAMFIARMASDVPLDRQSISRSEKWVVLTTLAFMTSWRLPFWNQTG